MCQCLGDFDGESNQAPTKTPLPVYLIKVASSAFICRKSPVSAGT